MEFDNLATKNIDPSRGLQLRVIAVVSSALDM